MVDKGRLIELVRERVTLWDQSDKWYHNRDLRTQLWEEVANELNIEGYEARKTWELVRDMYRKKLKETAAPGSAAKNKWTYFDALSFLFPMMKPRTPTARNLVPAAVSSDCTRTQYSQDLGEVSDTENEYLVTAEHDEQIDEPEVVIETNNALSTENTSSTSTADPGAVKCPGSKRRKGSTTQNEAVNFKRRKLQLLEARRFATPQTTTSEEDDDLSFFKSLIPSLKKLPLLRKMKLRSAILNCVIAELEAYNTDKGPCLSPTDTLIIKTPRHFDEYYSSDTSSSLPSPHQQIPGPRGHQHTFDAKQTRTSSGHDDSWPSLDKQ